MIYDENFIDKKLHTILEDAVFFMEESKSNSFDESDCQRDRYEKLNRRSAFARASILNSSFLLEATANCCIGTLEISNDLYDDVERMRTLSKFEYYLARIFHQQPRSGFQKLDVRQTWRCDGNIGRVYSCNATIHLLSGARSPTPLFIIVPEQHFCAST